MAIRSSLVLFLLAVALAPTLCESKEYKPCPTKGYYPRKANTTYTRCLAANELSCCEDCEDQYVMLRSISVNGTTLLDQFMPGLGEALGGKQLSVRASEFLVLQLCSSFLTDMFLPLELLISVALPVVLKLVTLLQMSLDHCVRQPTVESVSTVCAALRHLQRVPHVRSSSGASAMCH